jgi:ATP citrate (pro-S)-lyase
MINIKALRKPHTIVSIGNYQPVLQSILDFDYLTGRDLPSVAAIVTAGVRNQKLFWGDREILIPCVQNIEGLKHLDVKPDLFLNASSGRRAKDSSAAFLEAFPSALGGHVFAEDVPERHALELYERFRDKYFIVGPSGVGLLLPGHLKLGAIGGTDWRQLIASRLYAAGGVAVLSASGGMVNELIRMVALGGNGCSFALTFGGDRFPVTTPEEALLAAEDDPQTRTIVYYGELGGFDEYDMIELIKAGRIKKPVVAYIAGNVGEAFARPAQFGHAKALAGRPAETATAKRKALKAAGVHVAASIGQLRDFINKLPDDMLAAAPARNSDVLARRQSSLITSSISEEKNDYTFVGKTLETWESRHSLTEMIVAGLLGRPAKSKALVECTECIFQLALDHGPSVSGAMNTIVTARAGRDLVSALCAGLLTIGPRFGGAGNDAARIWFEAVQQKLPAKELVENYARQKRYILGIGHKKYRLGNPDPRVARLLTFVDKLPEHPYTDFAQSVAAITSAKKGNLILNFDGAFAAVLLDILQQAEDLSTRELAQLIESEFFNAYFVIPRSIGLASHYLDQKRLGEGLFRLPDNLVARA